MGVKFAALRQYLEVTQRSPKAGIYTGEGVPLINSEHLHKFLSLDLSDKRRLRLSKGCSTIMVRRGSRPTDQVDWMVLAS